MQSNCYLTIPILTIDYYDAPMTALLIFIPHFLLYSSVRYLQKLVFLQYQKYSTSFVWTTQQFSFSPFKAIRIIQPWTKKTKGKEFMSKIVFFHLDNHHILQLGTLLLKHVCWQLLAAVLIMPTMFKSKVIRSLDTFWSAL